MADQFRIEPVQDADMTRCMEIITPAFDFVPIQQLMTGPNTPENRSLMAKQHLESHREHTAKYPSVPVAIKCIHTDPQTKEETIVGYAEWFVWDRPRTPQEYNQEGHLFTFPWMTNQEDREYCIKFMQPAIDARRKLMEGRPFGLLRYMCVDPTFRRRGIGKLCVQWGLDRCAELGVPAYLEASEEAMAMYKGLGFAVLDNVHQGEHAYPVMIRWPTEPEEGD